MMNTGLDQIALGPADALVIVDVQRDFLPGGALAVPCGDEIIPVMNDYVRRFSREGLPVFATRDWHPPEHCSFQRSGGIWPAHCVAGTSGAAFAPDLDLPPQTVVISKAQDPGQEAYSAFSGTDLSNRLQRLGVRRLFVGGLATDYCVLHTVKDALASGFETVLLLDAARAVDAHPGDGAAAIAQMQLAGAQLAQRESLRDSPQA